MKAKYSCGLYFVLKFCYKTKSTSTWKAIVNAWPDVKNKIIWVIKKGHDTRFWKDNWIPGVGVLACFLESSIPEGESEFPVFHYVIDGNWNWNLIQRTVPMKICDKIAFLKPPCSDDKHFPCWNLSLDGYFSLKTAYEVMQDSGRANTTRNPIFNKVWKRPGPSRIKSLLWKLSHDRLMTNAERKKRRMTTDDLCPRCPETIMHLLIDCE